MSSFRPYYVLILYSFCPRRWRRCQGTGVLGLNRRERSGSSSLQGTGGYLNSCPVICMYVGLEFITQDICVCVDGSPTKLCHANRQETRLGDYQRMSGYPPRCVPKGHDHLAVRGHPNIRHTLNTSRRYDCILIKNYLCFVLQRPTAVFIV